MAGRGEDPIFGLPTPLVFAHRGGGLEAPECTLQAFHHALDARSADVLELDVQVTEGDAQFVVWHGPELDNVLIEGQPTRPGDRRGRKNDITEFSWGELRGRAWVAPADPKRLDLADTPRTAENRLLLLEEVLAEFPDQPLNVEMKDDSFRRDHVRPFLEVLERHRGERTILVVSQSHSLIEKFRAESEGRYPTGLSVKEALLAIGLGWLARDDEWDLSGLALQTTHLARFTSRDVIRKVHDAGGAVHVFLNGLAILGPALDAPDDGPPLEALAEIVERGVDGIFTDRPRHVRELLRSLGRSGA